MTVHIDARMLQMLTGKAFSWDACQLICDFFDELGDESPAMYIGDILVGFAEVDAKNVDREHDYILGWIDNEQRAVIVL